LIAIFYTKIHDRVLKPLFAAGQPQTPPPLRDALHAIDQHIDSRLAHASEAAHGSLKTKLSCRSRRPEGSLVDPDESRPALTDATSHAIAATHEAAPS
jgi:hypothetical protein